MAVNAQLSLAMQQALADAAARGVPVANFTATGQPDPAQPQPDPNAANPATQQVIANGVQDPAQPSPEQPAGVTTVAYSVGGVGDEALNLNFAGDNNTLNALWNPGQGKGDGLLMA